MHAALFVRAIKSEPLRTRDSSSEPSRNRDAWSESSRNPTALRSAESSCKGESATLAVAQLTQALRMLTPLVKMAPMEPEKLVLGEVARLHQNLGPFRTGVRSWVLVPNRCVWVCRFSNRCVLVCPCAKPSCVGVSFSSNRCVLVCPCVEPA